MAGLGSGTQAGSAGVYDAGGRALSPAELTSLERAGYVITNSGGGGGGGGGRARFQLPVANPGMGSGRGTVGPTATSPLQSILAGLTGGGGGGVGVSPKPIGPTAGMPQSPQQSIPSAPAPSGGGGGGGGGGGTTNTANANPISNDAIAKLNARTSGDMGLSGAFDRGIQDIRNRADFGIAAGMQSSRAARGVADSSIADTDSQSLARRQNMDINRMQTDFVTKREQDRDKNLKDIAGLGLGQGAQQIDQQRAAMQQKKNDEDTAVAQYDAQLRAQQLQQQAQQNQLSSILNVLSAIR